LANPLICRKAESHAGTLPARWGFINLAAENVVVSSIQTGQDGAIVVRVFEASGRAAKDVTLSLPVAIRSASEVNLLEDPLKSMTPDGRALRFDLAPFEIKTFAIRLAAIVRG